MRKNRFIAERINCNGDVWCYDCEKYLPVGLFIKSNSFYSANCKECRHIQYKKRQRLEQYPYGHWNIEDTEDIREQLKLLFKILGYNTEENIHQQFMEKYKNYFTNKK